MKLNKKGQGFFNYIMTYGWAILVVMVIVVMIWKLGFFKAIDNDVALSICKEFYNNTDYVSTGNRIECYQTGNICMTIENSTYCSDNNGILLGKIVMDDGVNYASTTTTSTTTIVPYFEDDGICLYPMTSNELNVSIVKCGGIHRVGGYIDPSTNDMVCTLYTTVTGKSYVLCGSFIEIIREATEG